MSAALWPEVTSALVSLWQNVTTVTVYDGMPLTYGRMTEGIAVGVSVTEDDGSSGDFSQEWRDAGPAPYAKRMETGSIKCSLWVQRGDSNAIAACRTRVFEILALITNAAADFGQLNVSGLTSLTPVVMARPTQLLTDDGTYVELQFTVTYAGIV